jgi:hypothetical protein
VHLSDLNSVVAMAKLSASHLVSVTVLEWDLHWVSQKEKLLAKSSAADSEIQSANV